MEAFSHPLRQLTLDASLLQCKCEILIANQFPKQREEKNNHVKTFVSRKEQCSTRGLDTSPFRMALS